MTNRSKQLQRLLIGYIALLFGTLPVAYPIGTTYLRDSVGRFITVEQIHFVEYIGLGVLTSLYARTQDQSRRTFPLVIGLLGILGLLDETVQASLPNRFFQWSDVGLNWAGSLLGLLAAGFRARWSKTA